MKGILWFFCLIVHSAYGWEILTATLEPPSYPILEGEDVVAKVSKLMWNA